MNVEPCPRCGSSTVVPGGISPTHDGAYLHFTPAHTRIFRMRAGVVVPPFALACTACGLFWGDLPAAELRAFIAEHGDELNRQQTDLQPFEGKDPKAIRAWEAVREIDALVLSDQAPAATRRFRERAGVTWDEALVAVRDWRQMSREAKLALLGWDGIRYLRDDLA